MVDFLARWNGNVFYQKTIVVNGFPMVLFTSESLLSMVFHMSTIGINGFPMVFHMSTIGINGFPMVFRRWTIGIDGFFNGHSLPCILALDDWNGVNKRHCYSNYSLLDPFQQRISQIERDLPINEEFGNHHWYRWFFQWSQFTLYFGFGWLRWDE